MIPKIATEPCPLQRDFKRRASVERIPPKKIQAMRKLRLRNKKATIKFHQRRWQTEMKFRLRKKKGTIKFRHKPTTIKFRLIKNGVTIEFSQNSFEMMV